MLIILDLVKEEQILIYYPFQTPTLYPLLAVSSAPPEKERTLFQIPVWAFRPPPTEKSKMMHF